MDLAGNLSAIQAMMLTLCCWHFSHSLISILKTRSDSPVTGRCAVPASHVMLLAWYGLSECSSLMLTSLGLFLPRCDAVTWARRLLLGANTPNCAGHRNRVRLSLNGGMRAASLPIKSIGSKKIWVLAGNRSRLDRESSIHIGRSHGQSCSNVAR